MKMASNGGPVNFKILLRQLNAIRVAVGIGDGTLTEMPKGRPNNASTCPIAMALSNGWQAHVSDHVSLTRFDRKREIDPNKIVRALRNAGFRVSGARTGGTYCNEVVIAIDLTKTMENFIYRFDEREFQDLIAGRDQQGLTG
jgi:hypothetical protein